ncbi:hypothetical protein FOA43_001047 [Brettanomyces nanus]|uniref:Metal homeostatis protein BSD2 n=1 Tax=Eeniella nana TaxID=13502 RepID=A0A875S330_EENNA|nr:uncharacterized protein FOA43_001047 [Brettanomyces nanus]QPG73734.1 hypothetical protein FOA43_001047 [Brettanomyces nanus]
MSDSEDQHLGEHEEHEIELADIDREQLTGGQENSVQRDPVLIGNSNSYNNCEGSSSDASSPRQYSVMERLKSTAKHTMKFTFNNAPLLRFFNRSNRYNRLAQDGRVIGESNDGVFSNLAAKPTVQEVTDNVEELPSYDEAVEDPAPPYWESSIMAGYEDEIFVDGLPVGNLVSFFWNMMVSVCFQFVGFVITYLLHTSHSAKNGSQAGLGVTLITFGWTMLPYNEGDAFSKGGKGQRFEPADPSSVDIDDSMTLKGSLDNFESNLPSTTEAAAAASQVSSRSMLSQDSLFSYSLIVMGTVIIIKAVYDYYKVRRKEGRLLRELPV